MYKTVWCLLGDGQYTDIRTFSAEVAVRKAQEWTEDCSYGRTYSAFDEGVNPNNPSERDQGH